MRERRVMVTDGRVVVVVKEVVYKTRNNYPNCQRLWLYAKSSVRIGDLRRRTIHALHEVKSV